MSTYTRKNYPLLSNQQTMGFFVFIFQITPPKKILILISNEIFTVAKYGP